MKNKIIIIKLALIIFIFFHSNAFSNDQFNFDVTELEITDNGNTVKGLKRGTILTDDGIKFDADEFIYDKLLNIFNASGNINIFDEIQNIRIYSDNATYLKNKQEIFTQGNSKVIDLNNNITINADNFAYDKLLNIFNANGNVKIHDKVKNIIIYSDDATYLKNKQKIFTQGNSKAINLDDDITIKANNFDYDKVLNVLNAFINVEIRDPKQNFELVEHVFPVTFSL